ncbi:hypothetical protein PIB30_090879 [Stylosanthes scabra]|uniref:Uncharacterized protein n=1 Tax=Stylosanthes scabra TaxID=79078 RepID=A0ABU6WUD0_9FABA|nr:hypothetical protein [Stylosanthes scabra]
MASLLTIYIAWFWTLFLISVSANDVSTGGPSSPFPAIFMFGDSSVDNGNNNYLVSFAKANFMPYGINTSWDPTGRFSNGKMTIDLLGELLGHSYLSSFEMTQTQGSNITWGGNYASAATVILDETGRYLGQRITFNEQVRNFQTTMNKLKATMDDMNLSRYLAKFVGIRESWKQRLHKQLSLSLHALGLRKFLLAAVGPLGCIPNQISRGLFPIGACKDDVNMVILFNDRLKSLVDELNTQYNGTSIFVYGNSYAALMQIIQDPNTYGFQATNIACCGIGMFQGRISCLPFEIPCSNRDKYVFWDAFHPSEAMDKILASRAFNGSTSDCYPINVSQMAIMF